MSRPINLTKLRELVDTVNRHYTAQDLSGTDVIVRVLPDQLYALIDTVEAAAAFVYDADIVTIQKRNGDHLPDGGQGTIRCTADSIDRLQQSLAPFDLSAA